MDKAKITAIKASAFRIPTSSSLETDGTYEWDSTILVVTWITAGDLTGIGYTYASQASADLINQHLAKILLGKNAFSISECWQLMQAAVRNIGRSGVAACSIAAVDNALWDLKAKLCHLPLTQLLGLQRSRIQVYGSGGFTNYTPEEIKEQINHWKESGITLFKIKIGRDMQQDRDRIAAAVSVLPAGGHLLVDANGAYQPKQAFLMAQVLQEFGVIWFEEPVTSDDIPGLAWVRDHAYPGLEIAAGEYGYNADDFRRMLEQQAVDVLQADATRCGGISGFLQAAVLSDAYHRLLSSHCAPSLHAPLLCHIRNPKHLEYFWDHSQIESLLFDGVSEVNQGFIAPQNDRPGLGIAFKSKDAEKFAL